MLCRHPGIFFQYPSSLRTNRLPARRRHLVRSRLTGCVKDAGRRRRDVNCMFMRTLQGGLRSVGLYQQCRSDCNLSSGGGRATLGLLLSDNYEFGYGCLFEVRGRRCPAGSFCSGGAPPQICPPGSFCEAGASAAVLCPAGTFGATPGLVNASCSGVCAFCAAGATAPVSSSQSPSQRRTASQTASQSRKHVTH